MKRKWLFVFLAIVLIRPYAPVTQCLHKSALSTAMSISQTNSPIVVAHSAYPPLGRRGYHFLYPVLQEKTRQKIVIDLTRPASRRGGAYQNKGCIRLPQMV